MHQAGNSGITPACAGSTLTIWGMQQQFRDHPRLRGEYALIRALQVPMKGSPPLARGVPAENAKKLYSTGITPACAGSTIQRSEDSGEYRDHPRLRGEYLPVRSRSRPLQGSPPLARGVHHEDAEKRRIQGITPACAGSTLYDLFHSKPGRDHPRLRGEYTKNSL